MTSTPNLPWVESPFFQQEIKQIDLSADLEKIVRQYAEDGYVIFDPQIAESVLDEAISGVEPLYKGETRVQDAWEQVPAVQKIATAPRVMEILRTLYRREPIPFQTLNFPVGTQQRTHSDSIHFHSIPQRFMCGVWVALEDVGVDNGPLHYYPGSHKLPFYDLIDMGIKGSQAQTVAEVYSKTYKQYEDRLEPIIKAHGLEKSLLTIKKGQALIWSANLLHGGEPIQRVGASRHSQVNHYFFEDCIYYSPLRSDAAIDKLYVRQITNIATGLRVPNKYFGQTLLQDGYAKGFTLSALIRRVGRLLPREIVNKLKR